MQLDQDDLATAQTELNNELIDLQDAIDDPEFHGNDIGVLSSLNEEKRAIEDLLERLELSDE